MEDENFTVSLAGERRSGQTWKRRRVERRKKEGEEGGKCRTTLFSLLPHPLSIFSTPVRFVNVRSGFDVTRDRFVKIGYSNPSTFPGILRLDRLSNIFRCPATYVE